VSIDEVDRRILWRLQEDARISRAALGREVGISPPAVHERIKKLERAGLIRGYRAVLDPLASGNELTAFVLVATTGAHFEQEFIEQVSALVDVQECHHVTGEYSLLLKIRTASIPTLEKLLLGRLGRAASVVRTNTLIVLSTIKEETLVEVRGRGGAEPPAQERGGGASQPASAEDPETDHAEPGTIRDRSSGRQEVSLPAHARGRAGLRAGSGEEPRL
jgi:Lrp/AsnC family transcriptional regulator, leucine-responsive regulatory protein